MPRPKKRIVVCSDGTWNDPEDENPTNVLRVARAIQPEDERRTQQVVFYDWGVGSYYAKTRGGVSGLGIMKNIQDGYRFIVQNFDVGDEIFLFGFSRGAYTARALAGMLNKCGILKRKNAHLIPDAFSFYKQSRIKPGSPKARQWRRKMSMDPERGEVDFIGVWDTVGALGIPTRVLGFVDEHDLFYDQDLGSNVKVARHAVAIDELRDDFTATLWTSRESLDLKQVWFAGVHGDVGGGTKERHGKRLSDIPLAWMAREAEATGLRFEPHLHGSLRGLHSAEANKSYKSFYRLRGATWRRIPTDGVLHTSVKNRARATGYFPPPVLDWVERNEGWGELEE